MRTRGSFQKWTSNPRQRSPKSQYLGCINAAAQTTRGDNRRLRYLLAHLADGEGGRNAPVAERSGDRGAARVFQAVHLHLRPGRPASTGDINGGDSCVYQLAGGLTGNAPADLFDNNRDGQILTDLLYFGEQTTKAGVAFRLKRFLQGIQMQEKPIRFDHVHRTAALVDVVPVIQLDCPKVGKQ